MNRRYFIKSGGIALASFGLMTSTPTFLGRALAETIDKVTGGKRKTLIAIFQRGAVDGLNVVVPYGEHSYYDLRPNIAIPKPDGGAEAARDAGQSAGAGDFESCGLQHSRRPELGRGPGWL